MLTNLSSLTLVTRLDATASAWALASGVNGTWVGVGTSSDGTTFVQATSGQFALPIFTESYRNKAIGSWTPDVTATKKLTAIYGKLHGITDQFAASPSVGDKLTVTADGKLQKANSGDYVVAICTRPSYAQTYLGSAYNTIEFMTV